MYKEEDLPSGHSLFLGIDIGLKSGAIGWVWRKTYTNRPSIDWAQGNSFATKPGRDPALLTGLLRILKENNCIEMTLIEKPQMMPGAGQKSRIDLGDSFGFWRGMLTGHDIPFKYITFQAWQSRMFKGLGRGRDTSKEKAYLLARSLYPEADLTGGRRVEYDTGIVDAIMIATTAMQDWRMAELRRRAGK